MPLKKVLFINHSGTRTGAPLFLLNFLKWFKSHSDIPFEILFKDDGELRSEFEKLAPVTMFNSVKQARNRFKPEEIGLIYSNTVANGHVLKALEYLNSPIITHAHELDYNIRHANGLEIFFTFFTGEAFNTSFYRCFRSCPG